MGYNGRQSSKIERMEKASKSKRDGRYPKQKEIQAKSRTQLQSLENTRTTVQSVRRITGRDKADHTDAQGRLGKQLHQKIYSI